mgnify:CR=1 FL=1
MSRPKIEVASYKGRRRPLWLQILLGLILAGVLAFAVLLGVVLSGAHSSVSGDPQVMIVLGCQVKPWGPSVLLQDRLDTALAYLQDHPDMTVVACGGQGADEPESEARAIADYLTENGVSKRNILLDEDSHNTHQNLENAAKLLSENDLDPAQTQVVVVSNGFHLTRARMLAQRCGFDEVSTLAAPESHLPSRLKMYLREPLALVKSFVADR